MNCPIWSWIFKFQNFKQVDLTPIKVDKCGIRELIYSTYLFLAILFRHRRCELLKAIYWMFAIFLILVCTSLWVALKYMFLLNMISFKQFQQTFDWNTCKCCWKRSKCLGYVSKQKHDYIKLKLPWNVTFISLKRLLNKAYLLFQFSIDKCFKSR